MSRSFLFWRIGATFLDPAPDQGRHLLFSRVMCNLLSQRCSARSLCRCPFEVSLRTLLSDAEGSHRSRSSHGLSAIDRLDTTPNLFRYHTQPFSNDIVSGMLQSLDTGYDVVLRFGCTYRRPTLSTSTPADRVFCVSSTLGALETSCRSALVNERHFCTISGPNCTHALVHFNKQTAVGCCSGPRFLKTAWIECSVASNL